MSETPNYASATSLPALHRSVPPAWWMLLLVGLLAFGVYANSLANDFAFDDLAIARGPHVTHLEWTAIWTDNYWPNTNGVQPDALYRPLTLWTYLANQALLPDAAWAFHLVNVALHALVTVLASVLAWRILGNKWVALVAGILFAVHPIHVEAVANTVGRAELLATLWALLALLVFLPAPPLGDEAGPARRPWWHGLLVAACFLAALLCKETPVSLLLALPLLDLWRWARWTHSSRPAWWRWLGGQTLRYYAPMTALLGLYMWLRIRACGLMSDAQVTHHIVNPLVDATPLERLVTPFMLLAKYLWITFWPVNLSADYSSPSLLATGNPFYATAFQPPAAAGMMVCVLALILAVRMWRKAPQIMLLLGLFGASYALVANFLRIGTIFGERLFYWPSVFVLIGVAWGMVALHNWLCWCVISPRRHDAAPSQLSITNYQLPIKALHTAAVALVATLVLLMGIRSRIRNTDWADNVALAISTARDNPDSGKACSWAGAVLIIADRPDYVAFGKTLLERAIELSPDYVNARWELAKYYGMRHELGPSAIRVAQAARIDPGTHMTRSAIPALLEEMRAGTPANYMPAIEAYQRDHPDDETAYLALAFGYHAQGQYDQAAAYARQALDVGKRVRADGFDQFHEAGAELATIWFDQGRLKEGTDKFRVYATFMRNSVDAHCTFASMLMALDAQTYPQALGEAEFNLAIASAIDPGNAKARELRGQLNRIRQERATNLASAGHKSGVGP